MALPRPSQKRLNKLLITNPAKFERYLAAYPDLADRFELENPLIGVTDSLRRAFDLAVDVPNDLAARMRTRMAESRSEATPLAVLLDLAGIGIATLGMLADDSRLAPNQDDES
jgi:hypothetical protein